MARATGDQGCALAAATLEETEGGCQSGKQSDRWLRHLIEREHFVLAQRMVVDAYLIDHPIDKKRGQDGIVAKLPDHGIFSCAPAS